MEFKTTTKKVFRPLIYSIFFICFCLIIPFISSGTVFADISQIRTSEPERIMSYEVGTWNELNNAVLNSEQNAIIAINADIEIDGSDYNTIEILENKNLLFVSTNGSHSITYLAPNNADDINTYTIFRIGIGVEVTFGHEFAGNVLTITSTNPNRVAGFSYFYNQGTLNFSQNVIVNNHYNLGGQTNNICKGVISNDSTGVVNINSGTFQNNYSYYGTLFNNGGTINIKGGVLEYNYNYFEDKYDNRFSNGATIQSIGGVVNVTGGNITKSFSMFKGGAIFSTGEINISGSANIKDCSTISTDVSANPNGGAIYSLSKININGGSIFNCSTSTIGKGGAIYCEGNVNISGGTLGQENSSNSANYGGGIYSENSILITGGVFNFCNAITAGGAVYGESTIEITGGTFENNSSPIGGAIYSDYEGDNALTIISSNDAISFIKNTATHSFGGAIYANNVYIALAESNPVELNQNTAYSDGGAIYSKKIKIYNVFLSENASTSGNGGAICVDDENGTFYAEQCTLKGNSAKKNGGALYLNCVNADIVGCSIGTSDKANTAHNGAGIYNNNNLTVSDSIIGYNRTTSNGCGGAIYNVKNLTLAECTISTNYSGTGTIYSTGLLNISGGSISNNRADNLGGAGLYIESQEKTTLSNSPIFELNVCDLANGGAIYIQNGEIDINSVDIRQNNSATLGGGIYLSSLGKLNFGKDIEINAVTYIENEGSNYIQCNYEFVNENFIIIQLSDYSEIAKKIVKNNTNGNIEKYFKLYDESVKLVQIDYEDSSYLEVCGNFELNVSSNQETHEITTELIKENYTFDVEYGDTYADHITNALCKRIGYEFNNWYILQDGSKIIKSLDDYIVIGKTLYAEWILESPSISITNSSAQYTLINENTKVLTINAFVENLPIDNSIINYDFRWFRFVDGINDEEILNTDDTDNYEIDNSINGKSALVIKLIDFSISGIGDYNYYCMVTANKTNFVTSADFSDNSVVSILKREIYANITNTNYLYNGDEINVLGNLSGNDYSNIIINTFDNNIALDIENTISYSNNAYTNTCAVEGLEYFTLALTLPENSNYTFINNQITWRITPIEFSLGLENNSLTYDGTIQDIAIISNLTASNEIALDSLCGFEELTIFENLSFVDQELDTNLQKDYNALGYKLNFKFENPSNYKLINSTLDWKITKLQLMVDEWVTDDTPNVIYENSYIYNALERNVFVTFSNVCGEDIIEVLYEGNGNKNVGQYTTKILSISNINYQLPTTNASFAWSIQKAQVVATWNYETPFTYDGSNQRVMIIGFKNNLDEEINDISINEIDYSGNEYLHATDNSLNAALDSNFYVEDGGIKYYIATAVLSSQNYEFMSSGNNVLRWRINQLQAELIWEETADFVYNGFNLVRKATIINRIEGDLVQFEYGVYTQDEESNFTVLTSEYKNVNNYLAKIIEINNEDYTLPHDTSEQAEYQISPLKLVVSHWIISGDKPYIVPFVYDATEKIVRPIFANVLDGDELSCLCLNNRFTDAGDYVASIDASSISNQNYAAPETNSFAWSIAKRDVSFKWSFSKVTYNGKTQTTYPSKQDIVFSDEANGRIVVSVTGNSEIDANDYIANVTLSGTAVDNYNIISGDTFNWSIEKASLNVVWFGNIELDTTYEQYTYDKTTKGVYAKLSGVSIDSVIETASVTEYSQNENVNAGSFVASIVAIDNDNYILPNSTFNWAISKKDVHIIWGDLIFQYSAEQQAISPTLRNADICEGDDISLVLGGTTVATNVGRYLATVSLSDNQNYKIINSVATENYWSIVGRDVTAIWVENSFVYDGTPKTQTATLVLLGSDTFSINNNEKINAGSYTATIQLEESIAGNYNILNPNYEWDIEQKIVEFDLPTDIEKTYNGQPQYVSISVVNGGTDEFVLEYENNYKISVGEHTTTIIGTGNSNYKLPEDLALKSFTWKIVKIVLAIDHWDLYSQEVISGIYDEINGVDYDSYQKKILPVFNNIILNEVVEIEIENNIQTTAGEFAIYLNVTNENYMIDESFELTFKINKRTLTINWQYKEAYPYIYNGLEHEVGYEIVGFINADRDKVRTTLSNFKTADAGSYTASLTLSANEGYETCLNNYILVGDDNDDLILTFDWEIQRRSIYSINWGVKAFDFDGTAKVPSVQSINGIDNKSSSKLTPKPNFNTILIYNENGQEVDSAIEAGSYTYVVLGETNNSNYIVGLSTINYSTSFVINPKKVNITWNYNSESPFSYDGNDHFVEANIAEGGLIAGFDAQLIPNTFTAKHHGIYSATVTGVSSKNYILNESITKSIEWKINKKSINVTWLLDGEEPDSQTSISLRYDGLSHTISAKVNIETPLIEGDSITFSYGGNYNKRYCGSYTADVTSNNSDYEVAESSNQKHWSILQKVVTLNVPSLIYNGTPQELIVNINGKVNDDDFYLKYGSTENDATNTPFTELNASTPRDITVWFAGNDHDNYTLDVNQEIQTSTENFVIAKCNINIVFSDTTELIYNSINQSVAYECEGLQDNDYLGITYSKYESDIYVPSQTSSDCGVYKATYTLTSNIANSNGYNNYIITSNKVFTSGSATLDYTIIKATPSIEIISLSQAVNGSATYYLVKASGSEKPSGYFGLYYSSTDSGNPISVDSAKITGTRLLNATNQEQETTINCFDENSLDLAGDEIYEHSIDSTAIINRFQNKIDLLISEKDSYSILVIYSKIGNSDYGMKVSFTPTAVSNINLNESMSDVYMFNTSSNAQSDLTIYNSDRDVIGYNNNHFEIMYGEKLTLFAHCATTLDLNRYGIIYGDQIFTTSSESICNNSFYMIITNGSFTMRNNTIAGCMIQLYSLVPFNEEMILSCIKLGGTISENDYTDVTSCLFSVKVNKKTINVEVNDSNKTFETEDPLYTADISGYIQDGVNASIYATLGLSDEIENSSFTFVREQGEDAGDYSISITGLNSEKYVIGNVITGILTINPLVVEKTSLTLGLLEAYYYTGSNILPTYDVKIGSLLLEESIDYTLAYSQNLNVGDGPLVELLLIGNYANSTFEEPYEYSFEILPIDASILDIEIANKPFTGDSISITNSDITAMFNGSEISTYEIGEYLGDRVNVNSSVRVNLQFSGNFIGDVDVTFSIVPLNVNTDKLNINITSNVDQLTYTGHEITPQFEVYYDGTLLLLNTDYEIIEPNQGENISQGPADITVSFKNNYYLENNYKFENCFTIGKKLVNAGDINVVLSKNYYYTSTQIQPDFELYYEDIKLIRNVDYTFVAFSNNELQGIGNIIVNMIGSFSNIDDNEDYEGNNITLNFNILKKDINLISSGSISPKTFNNSPITVNVLLQYSLNTNPTTYYNLRENVDYTLSYKNNFNVGKATVTVEGIGNFSGTKTLYFDIVKKSYNTDEFTVEDMLSDEIYTGKPIAKNDITITWGEIPLYRYKDYDLTFVNNVNVGNTRINISFKNNYSGNEIRYFEIDKRNVNENANEFKVSGLNHLIFADEIQQPNAILYYNFTGEANVEVTDWFDITYANTSNVGIAQIIFTAKENSNFIGTYVGYFEIKPLDITSLIGVSIANIPDQEFTGNAITPTPSVKYNEIQLTGTYSYTSNKNVGDSLVIFTGTGNYTGVVQKVFKITQMDITDKTNDLVFDVSNVTFDGEFHEPSLLVTLYGNEVPCTKLYSDNRNAGRASITITASGNYKGTASTSFIINAKTLNEDDLDDISISARVTSQLIYTGEQLKPDFDVYYKGIAISNFGISISNIDYGTNIDVNTKGSITYTLSGSIEGQFTKTFNISRRQYNLNEIIVSEIPTYRYTGKEYCPEFTLTYSLGETRIPLVAGVDYIYHYTDFIDVGTAHINISYLKNINGTSVVDYYIEKTPLTISDIIIISRPQTAVYSMEAISFDNYDFIMTYTDIDDQVITLSPNDFEIVYHNNIVVSNEEGVVPTYDIVFGGSLNRFAGTISGLEFEITRRAFEQEHGFVYSVEKLTKVYTGSEIGNLVNVRYNNNDLTEGTDYTLSYSANINVGRVDITIIGINNFEGEITNCYFNIIAKELNNVDFNAEIGTGVYNGYGIEPDTTLYFGETQLNENDYYVSYSNNVNVTESAVVIFHGINNFTGEVIYNFAINRAQISNLDLMEEKLLFVIDEFEYTGSAIIPDFELIYDGKMLVKDSDYQVNSISNNVNATTNDAKAIISIDFVGNYSGNNIEFLFDIKPKNLNVFEISIEQNEFGYTGQPITPLVVVRDSLNHSNVLNDENYEVVYINNTNAGIASIRVDAINNYAGSLSYEFIIYKNNYSNITHQQIKVIFTNEDMTLADLEINTGFYWVDETTKIVDIFEYADDAKKVRICYNANPENMNTYNLEVSINLIKGNYNIEDITITPFEVSYMKNMRLHNVLLPNGFSWVQNATQNDPAINGVGVYNDFYVIYNSNPSFYNAYNIDLKFGFSVIKGNYTVDQYAITEAIRANYKTGLTLNDIILPLNYTWNNPEQVITRIGTYPLETDLENYPQFTISYCEDEVNFNATENILIELIIEKGIYHIVTETGDVDEIVLPIIRTRYIYNPIQTLESISLPDGFDWEDPTQIPCPTILKYAIKYNDSSNTNYDSNFETLGGSSTLFINLNVVYPAANTFTISFNRSLSLEYGSILSSLYENGSLITSMVSIADSNSQTINVSQIVWVNGGIRPSESGYYSVKLVLENKNYSKTGYLIGQVEIVVTKPIITIENNLVDNISFYRGLINLFGQNIENKFVFGSDDVPEINEYFTMSELNNSISYTIEKSTSDTEFILDEGFGSQPFDKYSVLPTGLYRITAHLNSGVAGNYDLQLSNGTSITQISKLLTIQKANVITSTKNIEFVYGNSLNNFNVKDSLQVVNDKTITTTIKAYAYDGDKYAQYFEDGILKSGIVLSKQKLVDDGVIIGEGFNIVTEATKAGKYLLIAESQSDNFNFSYKYGVCLVNAKKLQVTLIAPEKMISDGTDYMSQISVMVEGYVNEADALDNKITYVFTKNGKRVFEIKDAGEYKLIVQFSNGNYYTDQVFNIVITPNYSFIIILVVIIVVLLIVIVAVILLVIRNKNKREKVVEVINEQRVQKAHFNEVALIEKLKRGEDVEPIINPEITNDDIKKAVDEEKALKKRVKEKEKENQEKTENDNK